MSEVRCYAVRITQNNDLSKVMNKDFANVINKYKVGILSPDAHSIEEQMKYLTTLIFLKKEDAEAVFRECVNFGIEAYWEKKELFVDDKYFEGGYK